jgi:hypothetical protein
VNDDGLIDTNDMYLVWKYFADTLTINNFQNYMTSKAMRNSRNSFDLILAYLNNLTGKNSLPMIKQSFLDAGYTNLTYNTDIVASSSLKPYVTTIGLYDGADLVAVAKLGKPIKSLPDFPVNFIVRIDT